jgi:predicted deacetylase
MVKILISATCVHRLVTEPRDLQANLHVVTSRTIAVALHDIEPATFERCALIRDWLADHGIERITLLVIPARDLHPLHQRRPDMAAWLQECAQRGDVIAQHGFQHTRARSCAQPRQAMRRLRRAGDAEFIGLDDDETRRAVDAGRRVLKLAGIDARGFIAPSYAYTPALRATLAERFDWWAGLLRMNRRGAHARLAPPVSLVSPTLVRAGSLLAGRTLRIDVHPADLASARHMLALESVLRRASDRAPITYDEIVAL